MSLLIVPFIAFLGLIGTLLFIYRRVPVGIVPREDPANSGEMVADDTEKTIIDKTSTTPFKGTAYLDLSELIAGDKLYVREYVKIRPDAPLSKFATSDFLGAVSEPAVVGFTKPVIYHHRVTIQQIAGVGRKIRYQYIVEA